MMKRALVLAALVEAATGAALLAAPALVGKLLLGAELTGVAVVVARVAGIALLSLAYACWPGTPRRGMLAYSTGVMLYLAYAGVTGMATGVLLWPAVGAHAVMSLLLVLNGGQSRTSDSRSI